MKKIKSSLLFAVCILISFALLLFSSRSILDPYLLISYSVVCILGFWVNQIAVININRIDVLNDYRKKFPSFVNKFRTWCLSFSVALFIVGVDLPDMLEAIAEMKFESPSRINRVFILLAVIFSCLPFFATFIWIFFEQMKTEITKIKKYPVNTHSTKGLSRSIYIQSSATCLSRYEEGNVFWGEPTFT